MQVNFIQKKNPVHRASNLDWQHWDDPEGWYGEGGGRKVQDGQIYVDIWQNQYNIVKLKNTIKKKRKKKERKKDNPFIQSP